MTDYEREIRQASATIEHAARQAEQAKRILTDLEFEVVRTREALLELVKRGPKVPVNEKAGAP